jgi:hypothetical protein
MLLPINLAHCHRCQARQAKARSSPPQRVPLANDNTEPELARRVVLALHQARFHANRSRMLRELDQKGGCQQPQSLAKSLAGIGRW